jgi:uncharacterized protein (TIGR02246 family)
VNDLQDAEAIPALLRRFHDAFAAGDADALAACFTEDGQMHLLHSEPALGRDAIRVRWRGGFERLDTSAWEPVTQLTEQRGDRAFAFSTYTERLLDRRSGERTLVRGRLVHWMARAADGAWRVTFLMNSHSHPMEPMEPIA